MKKPLDPKVRKAFADMRASLKKFDQNAGKALKTAAAGAAQAEREVAKATKEVASADAKAQAETKKLAAEILSTKASALKAYADVVKKSGGLTSMRPSVAKSLDKLMITLDEKHLKEAIKALEGHKAEVLKASGKNDPKASAFAKGIDNLISSYL